MHPPHRQSVTRISEDLGNPIAGALLLLVPFKTNYGDDNFFQFGNLPAPDKVGICLHLASLAALTGDGQLATRLRHRARNREAEDRIARQREALEATHQRLKLGPAQLPQQLQAFVDGVIWLSLEELGQQNLEHRPDLLSTVLTMLFEWFPTLTPAPS